MDQAIEDSVKKIISHFRYGFQKHVEGEDDLSVILLKAHLLSEYYLDHLILLAFDKEKNLRKLSFFDKISLLEKTGILDKYSDVKHVKNALKTINNIRNNLAHNLEFKIGQTEVDIIGYNFGKEYVLKKYSFEKIDNTSLVDILKWLAENTLSDINYILANEVLRNKPNNTLQIPYK